ncbi:putative ribonuclease H-like domain-containing protein [Tanacetum coccineum]|uniref:Ribonuclease H-like domain-containing protein n=1 Tax=Tanacetum coccineum TaxID=301880 RepID=A0ABQ5C4I1_9ASTR
MLDPIMSLSDEVIIIASDAWRAFESRGYQNFKDLQIIVAPQSGIPLRCDFMGVLHQQNGVTEWKNRTLIEAARTITPLIDFMKPFGCLVTILNTKDHLGKFDGKADEGFFVGYFVVRKAMRVFNKRTGIVEETLNIRLLENAPNVTGNGPDWLFDVDSLTISMNYVPVVAGNQTNGIAGTRDNIVAGQAKMKKEPKQEYIMIPFCTTDPLISQGPKDSEEDSGIKPTEVDESGASDKDEEDDQATKSKFERLLQQEQQTEYPNKPKKVIQALKDPSWIEAIQEELLKFQLQKVWTPV